MHMKFDTENPKQTLETMMHTESRNREIQYGHQAELIFKAKLKVESWNQNIQNGHQAAILEVKSLKIYGYNQHEKQTWLLLWKPCRLQTMSSTDRQMDRQMDRRTDGQTDGQGESGTPPPNIKIMKKKAKKKITQLIYSQ